MVNYSGYFLDPEVVLEEGDPVIGAERLFEVVGDKNVFAVTDDTSLSSESMIEVLGAQGLGVDGALTGVDIVENGVSQNRFYVLGGGDLMGSDVIVNDESASDVLLGFDDNFSYRKVRRAWNKVGRGSGKVYVCSRRATTSLKGARPHQRPLNKALESLGDSELVGFPTETALSCFRKAFSYLPSRSLMVSDRFDMVEAGNRLGMDTALLLSHNDRSDISGQDEVRIPDLGVSSVQSLSREIQFSSS